MQPNKPITKVVTGKEVREKIRAGIDVLEHAVGDSLGPRGLSTGIDRQYENVIIRDGVNIAKSIWLEDSGEQFAVSVMREAAQKSVDEVGDSTSATVVLAHAIYVEAEKRVATGISPRLILDEVNTDIKKAVEILESKAIPVTTLEQKIQVAQISCEEDELGKLIGETIHKMGDDGVVTVDPSKNGRTEVEMQNGMQWDRGYASPYFQTHPETRSATVTNGYVLVTDHEITNIMELKPFLDDFITKSRFLTIIAPDFSGDALSSLIANKLENKFIGLCVKAPSFGRQQTDMLQDIALLTGATFISKDKGHKVMDIRMEHLGKAQKVTAYASKTELVGGEGNKELVDARVTEVKALIEEEKNDFELERLKERLAKLTNGVAVIKVGGATDIEMKERYERALDATLATRQAVKKGIVPGGEVTYLSLIGEMKSPLIVEALKAPFKRLMTNAGLDAGQQLERLARGDKSKKKYIFSTDSGMSAEDISKINMDDPDQLLVVDGDPSKAVHALHLPLENAGVDVSTGKVVDMISTGIIDPVSCSIAALTNAASVALQLLNTTTLVLPQPPKDK